MRREKRRLRWICNAPQQEISAGEARQVEVRKFLASVGKQTDERLFKNRDSFLQHLRQSADIRLSASELKAILSALIERDETADICSDSKGRPEPDADLRDTAISCTGNPINS